MPTSSPAGGPTGRLPAVPAATGPSLSADERAAPIDVESPRVPVAGRLVAPGDQADGTVRLLARITDLGLEPAEAEDDDEWCAWLVTAGVLIGGAACAIRQKRAKRVGTPLELERVGAWGEEHDAQIR